MKQLETSDQPMRELSAAAGPAAAPSPAAGPTPAAGSTRAAGPTPTAASSRERAGATGPRVLVLSREYPNRATGYSGVWVERLVRSSLPFCAPRVISPVPYAPPLPRSGYYGQFRAIERHDVVGGVDVFHPRFLIAPAGRGRGAEPATYYAGIRREADRLHEESPFEVIHAHFTYPDGVAAVLLGKRYGVPVVITEHAPWGPWLRQQRLIRRQMVWAANRVDAHIAVSHSVRRQIEHVSGRSGKVQVIPNAVDAGEFPLANGRYPRVPDKILYVGHINEVKGVDVLLEAMKLVLAERPSASLVMISATFYRAKAALGRRMEALAGELGLDRHVNFVGAQTSGQLVRHIHESSLLVLPSRAESFGCVLVEALACGRPVVATRCGGPEDIVDDDVGRLVEPEDPRLLAAAMLEVLARRESFEPSRLRAYALDRFSCERVGERMGRAYEEVLEARAASG